MSISEDMKKGLCCEWCGIYFEKEHGYPVLCNNCFDDDIEESQECGFQRAKNEEL